MFCQCLQHYLYKYIYFRYLALTITRVLSSLFRPYKAFGVERRFVFLSGVEVYINILSFYYQQVILDPFKTVTQYFYQLIYFLFFSLVIFGKFFTLIIFLLFSIFFLNFRKLGFGNFLLIFCIGTFCHIIFEKIILFFDLTCYLVFLKQFCFFSSLFLILFLFQTQIQDFLFLLNSD